MEVGLEGREHVCQYVCVDINTDDVRTLSAHAPVHFVLLRAPSLPAALRSLIAVPSLSAGAERMNDIKIIIVL